MLVIAADADPMFQRFVAQSLAGTEFESRVAETVGEACAWAEGASPVVFLHGWGSLDAGGAEVLARLRQVRAPRERYAIATLGPGEATSLVAAIEAGADDVLVKPFSAEVLLSRLRLAARRCAAPERAVGSLREVLREALADPIGGEIVVRVGGRVGRVHVSDRKIAWAHLAGEPVRLGGLVRSVGVSLDEDSAAAVIEEARSLNVHFADVLVRWGYLDEAGARECVRALVAEQLGALLGLPDAAALFLPRSHAYASRLSFPLAEVAAPSSAPRAATGDAMAPVSVRPPPDRLAGHGARIAQVMQLGGAIGAAVIDRSTGVAWACAGEDVDGELAWSLLGTLGALGPEAEDVLATRRGAVILARPLDAQTALVAAFALDRTTLGLVRASMKHLGGLSRPPEDNVGEQKEGTNG